MTPLRLIILATLAALLTGCAELRQLRERTEIQDREIVRLRQELAEWQTAYHDLRAQRDEELAGRLEREETLQSEITRLQTRQSVRERELESEVAQLRDQIRMANTELATRQQEALTLREQSQRLTAQLDEAETGHSVLLAQLEEVETNLSETAEEATTARQSEQQLRSSLLELRGQLQQEIEERNETITDLRNRLLETEAQRGGFRPQELERIETYLRETLATAGGPEAQIASDAENGVVVTMSSAALFEEDSTVVNSQAERTLTALGYALQQLPETSINVVGHTDTEPVRNLPFRDNWQLSASRAENVARVLIGQGGVDPERVVFTAAGPHQPIASNQTLEGRVANRRVEIIVTPQRGG
jgi:flagellar motor protein MotB